MDCDFIQHLVERDIGRRSACEEVQPSPNLCFLFAYSVLLLLLLFTLEIGEEKF